MPQQNGIYFQFIKYLEEISELLISNDHNKALTKTHEALGLIKTSLNPYEEHQRIKNDQPQLQEFQK